jgi:hypothetical protein
LWGGHLACPIWTGETPIPQDLPAEASKPNPI